MSALRGRDFSGQIEPQELRELAPQGDPGCTQRRAPGITALEKLGLMGRHEGNRNGSDLLIPPSSIRTNIPRESRSQSSWTTRLPCLAEGRRSIAAKWAGEQGSLVVGGRLDPEAPTLQIQRCGFRLRTGGVHRRPTFQHCGARGGQRPPGLGPLRWE